MKNYSLIDIIILILILSTLNLPLIPTNSVQLCVILIAHIIAISNLIRSTNYYTKSASSKQKPTKNLLIIRAIIYVLEFLILGSFAFATEYLFSKILVIITNMTGKVQITDKVEENEPNINDEELIKHGLPSKEELITTFANLYNEVTELYNNKDTKELLNKTDADLYNKIIDKLNTDISTIKNIKINNPKITEIKYDLGHINVSLNTEIEYSEAKETTYNIKEESILIFQRHALDENSNWILLDKITKNKIATKEGE